MFYRQNRRSRQRSSNVYRCLLCQRFHSIRFCGKFIRMDAEARNRVVRKHHYCINCLAKSHTFRNCKSKNTCKKCQSYHHTLLHTRVKATSRSRLEMHNNNRNPPDAEPASQQTSPDQRILSEAIRSLASVLCATSNQSATNSARRHV